MIRTMMKKVCFTVFHVFLRCHVWGLRNNGVCTLFFLGEGDESGDELNELEDTEDDIDQDAQDYATLLKELNEGDDNWEGETGLGKPFFLY